MMVMAAERERERALRIELGMGWWSGDGEGKWVVESASCSTTWRGSWWRWLQIKVLGSVDQSIATWLEAQHGIESDRE